jgi:hypothetical protein
VAANLTGSTTNGCSGGRHWCADYTLAYGTDSGYVDLDGTREPVPVDREEMKQIPAATNGSIFAAATADQLKGEPEHRVRCWLREGRPLRDSRFAGYGLALIPTRRAGSTSLACMDSDASITRRPSGGGEGEAQRAVGA